MSSELLTSSEFDDSDHSVLLPFSMRRVSSTHASYGSDCMVIILNRSGVSSCLDWGAPLAPSQVSNRLKASVGSSERSHVVGELVGLIQSHRSSL